MRRRNSVVVSGNRRVLSMIEYINPDTSSDQMTYFKRKKLNLSTCQETSDIKIMSSQRDFSLRYGIDSWIMSICPVLIYLMTSFPTEIYSSKVFTLLFELSLKLLQTT